MGRGDRGFFRHSVHAAEDDKICEAIDAIGKEAYFYYFTLIELCVLMADGPGQTAFKIHSKVISKKWRVQSQSVHKVLTKLQLSGLLVVTKLEQSYLLDIPNLSKYFGSGVSNRIEKNRKEQNRIDTPIVPKKKNHKVDQEEPGSTQLRPEVFHQIISIWNEHIIHLPKIKSGQGPRLTRCNVLWKVHPHKEYWIDLFKKINETRFLNGENDRNWKASLDWVLKGDNRNKILEGNYDFMNYHNSGKPNKQTAANEQALAGYLSTLNGKQNE